MFCPNCGKQIVDGAVFCPECGAKIPTMNMNQTPVQPAPQQAQGFDPNQQAGFNGQTQSNGYNQQAYNSQPIGFNPYQTQSYIPTNIQERGIAVAIILSIVTCGIYAWYWMYKLNDEVNELAGEVNPTSGGVVILLSIITCGIYSWYWLFKMGERTDRIKSMRGQTSSSDSALYLILGIFGLSIVAFALIQDSINQAVR